MLIVACQKCGEVKVIAGSPDADGVARAVWTCSHCGAGQVMEITISKDARRGDLRKIIGGLALARPAAKQEEYSMQDGSEGNEPEDAQLG